MKKYAYINILIASLVLAVFVFTACEKENPEPSEDILLEGWNIERVDSIAGAEAGIYNVLAYDADSGIHIAYVVSQNNNYSLKYAYKPYNGNWTTTEVENPISSDIIDISVDNQKNVFIAYRGYAPVDNDNERLYIAEKSITGSFNSILVDVLGETQNFSARYPSIYADNNDIIHIAFERANYGMRYTTYSFQECLPPLKYLMTMCPAVVLILLLIAKETNTSPILITKKCIILSKVIPIIAGL